MDHTRLRTLLVIHGFITLAAGIVLAVAPDLIPSVVGIHLAPSAIPVEGSSLAGMAERPLATRLSSASSRRRLEGSLTDPLPTFATPQSGRSGRR
jgi:hypothetical protein